MKKYLAVLLSLVMVLSLLGPVAAAVEEDADPEEPAETVAAAVEEAPAPAEYTEPITDEQPAAEEPAAEEDAEEPAEEPASEAPAVAEEPAEKAIEAEAEAEAPEEEVPVEDAVSEEEAVPEEDAVAEAEPAAEEPAETAEPVIPTQFARELDNVTVSAATKSGAFSVPVVLQVTPLAADSAAYKEADEALAEKGYAYDGMLAFDIGFIDGAGEAVEPAGDVYISLKLKTGGVVPENAETALVAHITDDGVEPVADTAELTPGHVTLDADALSANFVVDSFSTFTISWTVEGETDPLTATIHFVELNEDGTVKELDPEVSLDTSAATVSLNTDFPDVGEGDGKKEYRFVAGYYAAEAVTHPADDAVNIKATLTKAEDGTWTCAPVDGSAAITVAPGSHLYATYKQFAPAGETPDTGNAGLIKPDSIKNVTDNKDGTYTIRLDINGHQYQEKAGANVLLVFDRTSSMVDNNMGSVTRFAAAKSAVHTLVEALDPSNNPITMAAMSFARTADASYVTWTTSGSAITAFTDGLNAAASGATPGSGGTNWEAAFDMAKTIINSLPDANKKNPTYLVFLTDGNPTIYVGSNSIIQANENSAEYTRARASASGLNSAIPIYGILCANADDGPLLNTLMTQLATATYGSHETHYVLADNESTLTSTFQQIGNKIVADLGASQASTNDGVTSLSTTSATAGAAGAFKYYKTTRPAGMEDDEIIPQDQLVPWSGAPAASYSSSTGVTWDLESVGVLEDNTSYTLEFTVWPSQAAYDLIADLNNGLKSYDSLDDATKAQVYESGGKYYLRTNTNFDTTYSFQNEQYTDPGTTQSEGSMVLPTETISIEKIWNNLLDQAEPPESATLYLTKDKKDYLVGEDAIVVSQPSWQAEVYISLGQILKNTTDNTYEVLEKGHDYEVVEPKDSSYRWELTSEIFRPMVINGIVVMLVKDDAVTGKDGVDYYTIDGTKYKPASGSNNLRAWNDRRSWLQLEKKVTGTGAPTDALFEFTVTVTDPQGEDIWFTAWDPDLPADADGNRYVKDLEVEGATAEVKNGEKTGAYYAASGSTVKVKIEAGWTVRFLNLLSGTTYSIEESSLPDGFAFDSAKGSFVKETDLDQGTPETPTISNMTGSGTINVPNTEFYVEYTNKYEETEITVTKEWVDNNDQIGTRPTAAAFKSNISLVVNGDATTDYNDDDHFTVTDNGNGTYTISYTGLPKYIDNKTATYEVEETTVPKGYAVSGSPAQNGGKITNTLKVGSLIVSKTVDSTLTEDQNARFTFTITTAPAVSGTFPATGVKGIESVTFDKDGKATVRLANEDVLTITGLAADVVCTVTETANDAYETKVNGQEKSSIDVTIVADKAVEAAFTNTRKMIDVKITKVWEDQNDKYKIRPQFVIVELYASVGESGIKMKVESGDVDNDNNWTVTYKVPEFDANGNALVYSADEVQVRAGYVKEVTGSAAEGFTIKNTFDPPIVDPPVGKTVNGSPSRDETFTFMMTGSSTTDTVPMPDAANGATEMTVEITGNGTKEFGEFALTEPGTYTYVISEVAGTADGYIYDDTVYTIVYEVTANADNALELKTTVDKTEIKDNKLTAADVMFTNDYEKPTVDVSVTKVWTDADDKDGIRPDSVTINLLADGEETGASVTLNEDNGWKGSFINLPKYADNKEIEYTISEVAVEGYTTTISGSAASGFTVTNVHVPDETPPTGDSNLLGLWVSLLSVSALGIGAVLKPRKKKD